MTVTGASVGLAQGLVLQPYTRRSNADSFRTVAKWTILSTIGATIGWFVSIILRMIAAMVSEELIRDPVLPIIVFFIGGATFGLVQWFAWDSNHLWTVIWWAFVNAVGWSAGTVLGVRAGDVALMALFPNHLESILLGWPEAFQIFVAGAIAILVYSLITAIGLLVVLWRSR